MILLKDRLWQHRASHYRILADAQAVELLLDFDAALC